MTRKWIASRIDSLDPNKDYDEIWRLSAAYRPNDFIMNLVYAVTFPHFFVRELDALPLFNDGDGKILKRSDTRADDTSWKMQVWWNYGSTHESTVKNVESINRLHEHYAKKFPESFSRNDTYVYTLCYEAAGMHRLFQRVGLAGFSEKEKIASVHYWTNMAKTFRNAGTGEALVGFPETFDGIMAFMDRWESEEVSPHKIGPPAAQAIMEQFADRYFAKAFHPLVFKWLASLYPDHVLKAFSIKKPSPVGLAVLRKLTAWFFLFGEKVLPDPIDTFEERRLRAKNKSHDDVQPNVEQNTVKFQGSCPHLQNLQREAQTKSKQTSKH
jgi:hypothetical protein